MIICIALFVFGLILIIRSGKRLNDLEKYEFENRSDGGVVQFASFKAAKKHEWREFRAKFGVFNKPIFNPAIDWIIFFNAMICFYCIDDQTNQICHTINGDRVLRCPVLR